MTAMTESKPAQSKDKAREALEKLLRQVEAGKVTGEAYLRIYLNQGGVRAVRFAVEGECG